MTVIYTKNEHCDVGTAFAYRKAAAGCSITSVSAVFAAFINIYPMN